MNQLAAGWIAQPVLAHARTAGPEQCLRGTVLGCFGATVHAELDSFVVVIQPDSAPRMPNGLGVPARATRRQVSPRGAGPGTPKRTQQRPGRASNEYRSVQAGDPATLRPGQLQAGELQINWDAAQPPAWSAEVPRWPRAALGRAADRARGILAGSARAQPATAAMSQDLNGKPVMSQDLSGNQEAHHRSDRAYCEADPAQALVGVGGFGANDPGASDGLKCLLYASRAADASAASEAARVLVGRGSGLTPVGDDALAAAALTLRALGSACGHPPDQVHAAVASLLPTDIHLRTTPISATLLELACRGHAIGPARALLDPRPSTPEVLDAALRRLGALGHSTGPAYVNTIGALMAALAAPAASHPEKELVR